tara:strand:- start:191 stop:649 length:459 start_codon:yes stop_codon:yes gene_type:complete
MSVNQAYNFRAIDETVSTAGLLSEEQLTALGAAGYQAVINLLPHDSQYAIENEEDIVTGQGIDYLYIPVDFAAPADEDYSEFVKAVQSCQAKKVLIHCAANFRVSAFYSMYAYEYLGWPASRAWAHIESIWNPRENPPWDRFIAQHISDDRR